MSIFDLQSLLLFLIAIVANTLSAMAGGGAGLLQLPVLLLMGLPFGVALATHKIATVALGVGSTLRYRKEGLLEWRLAIVMLAFGLPGVIVGANVILRVSDHLATIALGFLTLGLGVYSMVKPALGQVYQPRHRNYPGLLCGGVMIFIIGVANGSLTSGTGLFATLWFIYWFGLDYQRAVAMTLVLVGFFWNGAGALTLSLLGDVKWQWVIPLVSGSLVGGYWGAHLAVTRGNRLIKRLFEGLTLIMGLSLIVKGFL